MRYDVIVCGAGVGGLTLARALSRQGRSVLLVEKQRECLDLYKGEVLQPKSLEFFDRLGVLEDFRRESAVVDRLVCARADGREICTLDYRRLPCSYNHCLVHTYKGITGLLAAEGLPGVEVLRGARGGRLLIGADGRVGGLEVVDGAEATPVAAPLVVACDGTASKLRAEAGLEAHTTPYRHEVVAFDVEGVGELPPQATTHVTADGIRLVYPMPDRRARFYAQVPSGGFRGIGRAGLGPWVEDLIRQVAALQPIADQMRASLAGARVLSARRSVCPRWSRPGFALLGDAAHCVHPMAGQGMNAAIADAEALARRLAAVPVGDVPALDEAVADYDAAGRARMEFVSRFSHNFADLFTNTAWHSQTMARHILRRHRSNARLSFMVMYNLSGFGVLRFSTADRLYQLGLPDLRARRLPAVDVP